MHSISRAGIFLCAFSLIGFCHAESITMASDNWCPYSCSKDYPAEGIGPDIARKILTDHGYDVENHVTTWDEAIRLVNSGKADILIGTIKTETPDLIFTKYHFSYSRSCFVQKTSDAWRYTGVKSLSRKRIGVMKDYSYGAWLDKYLLKAVKKNNVVSRSNTKELFDDLDNTLTDLILDDDKVAMYFSKKNNNHSQYKFSGCQPRTKLYYAMSPVKLERSEIITEVLNKGLYEMLRNDEVKKIHKQYGIEEY